MKRLLLLSAVLALLLPACAPQVVEQPVVQTVVVEQVVKETVEVEVTAEPSAEEKVLNFAFSEPTMGLDPAIAGTSTSKRVIQFMHDSLWEWDEDMNPQPWMAESWDIASDYTSYTFHLRPDLKFSDGSPITAEDVKFSFEYMAESELWEGRLSVIESIETPDAQTVVINMNRSVPEFMLLPSFQVNYFIVSKAAVEAGADFNAAGTPVSGPFVLEEWVPKSHLVLVKNPHWWGVEALGYPKFDKIFHRFNEQGDAGVAAVESGAADIFAPVSAKDVPRLRKSPGVMLYEARRATVRGFGMDKAEPPFSDKRVRQAIGLATKPDEATEVCWFDTGGTLWGGIIYPWQKDWYTDVTPWDKPRDEKLAEAKALLDEAGWKDEDGDGVREAHGVEGVADGTPFEVSVPFESNWPQAECHTLLLQDWMSDIGIAISPDRYDPASYWSDVLDHKFKMWHYGHGTNLWGPAGFNTIFHSDGAYNQYSFQGSVPELDAMIEEMLAETDKEKVKELLHEIEVYIADNQFIIATGSQNALNLVNARVVGYHANSVDSQRALITSDIPGR